jgi:hypothetical protein
MCVYRSNDKILEISRSRRSIFATMTHKIGIVLVLVFLLAACSPAVGPSPTLSGGQETVTTPTQVVSQPTAAIPPATESNAQPTQPPAQPTLSPTAMPGQQPAPTPAGPARSIVLESPQNGATITSPVQVSGQVSVSPFEATLRGRVYDAQGQVLGEGPIMVAAEMGQSGSFGGGIVFRLGASGPGRVEVADISPKDGAVLASAMVDVVLAAGPGPGKIEVPAAEATVALPLHILARVGQPGEEIGAVLHWQDGTELAHSFTTLRGEDGGGLLIDSLNWPSESQPPEPATQPATLELRSQAGEVLASQRMTVLSPNDPDARDISLFFILGENFQPVHVRIPQTQAIGTAALEDLLWGPPPPNLAGFTTAIPTPQDVLSYPGRQPGWGPRVKLLKLAIVDGVATADFSREMGAYGGGSLRAMLIRQQITQTLMQFPTVNQVIIAVEGQTEDVLQP